MANVSFSELRAEILFPSSGLLNFNYPENFLSLSMPHSSQVSEAPQSMIAGDSPHARLGDLGIGEEKSWLFYLAEISLRGITSRVLEYLYAKGETHWQTDPRPLLNQYHASHEELLLWQV